METTKNLVYLNGIAIGYMYGVPSVIAGKFAGQYKELLIVDCNSGHVKRYVNSTIKRHISTVAAAVVFAGLLVLPLIF